MKKNEIMPFAEKNDWNWSSLFLSGTLRKKKKRHASRRGYSGTFKESF
jgi:hypothetical protein